VDPLSAAANFAGLPLAGARPVRAVKSSGLVTKGTQTSCTTKRKTYVAIIKSPNGTPTTGPATTNIKTEISVSAPCQQKNPNKSAILKLPKTLRFARNNLQDGHISLKPNNPPVHMISQPLNTIPHAQAPSQVIPAVIPQAMAQPQAIPQPQPTVQPTVQSMVQPQQINIQPMFSQPQYYNVLEPITDQVNMFSNSTANQRPVLLHNTAYNQPSLDFSLEQEDTAVQWDEFLQPITKKDDALLNVGSPDSGLGVDSLLNSVDEFSDFSDLNDENLGEPDLFSDIYFS